MNGKPAALIDGPLNDTPTIRTLDGLRALFLFWVFFYHLPMSALAQPFIHMRERWSFGVDGFLAVSGFLVTRSLAQCAARARAAGLGPWAAARDFAVRRAARIWPPYFAVLGGVVGLALWRGGFFAEAINGFRDLLWRFATFTANYAIADHYDRIPLSFQTWWSVSYQEQIYLLLVVLYLLSPRRMQAALLALGLLSIALRAWLLFGPWGPVGHGYAYESYTHLNFDGMVWGCLAWIRSDQLGQLFGEGARRRWLMRLVLVVTIGTITFRSFFPSETGQVLLMTVRAPALALLIWCVAELDRGTSLTARFLRWQPLNFVSRVSFEAYLVHAPLYSVLRRAGVPDGRWLVLTGFVSAIVVGAFFHYGFGRPVQRWVRARYAAAAPKGRLVTSLS